MSRRPRTLKEWNLFRMASGYVVPCRSIDVLYRLYERYPDLCLMCAGTGRVSVGMMTPFGILVEHGMCPSCRGEGEAGWYSVN